MLAINTTTLREDIQILMMINDNDRCHDNYDGNFGNFDDNDDRNTEKPTNIVNFG